MVRSEFIRGGAFEEKHFLECDAGSSMHWRNVGDYPTTWRHIPQDGYVN